MSQTTSKIQRRQRRRSGRLQPTLLPVVAGYSIQKDFSHFFFRESVANSKDHRLKATAFLQPRSGGGKKVLLLHKENITRPLVPSLQLSFPFSFGSFPTAVLADLLPLLPVSSLASSSFSFFPTPLLTALLSPRPLLFRQCLAEAASCRFSVK